MTRPAGASEGSTATGSGDGSHPSPAIGTVNRRRDRGILLPLLSSDVLAVTDQVRIASALASTAGTDLSVINLITVPEQTPPSYGPRVSDHEDEDLLEWALAEARTATEDVDGRLLYTRDVVRGILRTVRTHDVGTLVLPRAGAKRWFGRSQIDRIATQADCEVVVVNGRAGYDGATSILLPIAGGPHSGLATAIARSVAADCDAWIDVLHVIDEEAPARERESADTLLEAAHDRIARPRHTTTWLLEAEDVADAIIEQSQYYDLPVIGAPTKGRLRRFIHGSTNRAVRSAARSVVLSVRHPRRE